MSSTKPSWLGSPTPFDQVPVVVKAASVVVTPASGQVTTTLFTTPTTYSAGTYLVGMTIEGGGTFISTDWAFFRVSASTGSVSVYPEISLAFTNPVTGTGGTFLGTLTGILVLPVASPIVYDVTTSLATASKSFYGEGMWLQRIA